MSSLPRIREPIIYITEKLVRGTVTTLQHTWNRSTARRIQSAARMSRSDNCRVLVLWPAPDERNVALLFYQPYMSLDDVKADMVNGDPDELFKYTTDMIETEEMLDVAKVYKVSLVDLVEAEIKFLGPGVIQTLGMLHVDVIKQLLNGERSIIDVMTEIV